MAYKQPRVPPMKDGTRIAEYIRELILFLKDFCLETWRAVTQIQRDTAGDRVTSINGKSGEVTLGASDVGALPSDGTAADSAKLNGKAPEYYIQPRNLLDNSDFTNPVNQRNAVLWSTGYGIDRWMAEDGESFYDSTSRYVYVPSGGYLVQRVPSDIVDITKTYTLAAADAYGNVYVGDDAGLILMDDSGSYGFWSIKLTGGRDLIWAALYEGEYTADTLPPYIPKGYAAELMECLRYFRRMDVTAYGASFPMAAWGDDVSVNLYLEYPMRIVPSLAKCPVSPEVRASNLYETANLSNPYINSVSTERMISIWWAADVSGAYETNYFLQYIGDESYTSIYLSADL